MMNATAVLPAGAAMAFAGNAATISDNSAQGGFSDTLGAMVTGGKQSGMSSAIRADAEEQTALSGEILSGLTELEQSAEELKQLLKTAELAGYMQGAMVQTVSDIPTADNAELMQILAGNDGMQSVVQTVVQNGTDQVDVLQAGGYAGQAMPKSEIVSGNSENDLAENADFADSANIVPENDLIFDTYSTDENVSGKAGMRSEGAVKSGDPTETDISLTTYNTEASIGDVSKNAGHNIAGRPEDNIVASRAFDSMGKSDPEDVAVTGKGVNDESGASDINVVGKYDIVTDEAKQEVTAEADNVPRVAYTKRNVEVKSEELRAITKGSEMTKSDSDLDAEQKVTDKNSVSDMSAGSANIFARTESRIDDDGQPAQTVRVPISDMASFVSEHAPKANGKSTLTVVLTPETLGKITVRMVNESGKLSVEILTETQAAKELLQAKSEQLAYALRNDDVELASYKVETSQAELFQRDFDGSSKNPYRQQSHSRQKDDTDDFDSMLSEIQAMG